MTSSKASPKRRESRPVSFLSLTIFALILLGISAVVFLWVKDPDQKVIFSDLFFPIIESLALVSLLLAARHSAARSKRLAFAWGIIGLGMLFYMLGDVIWGILELVLKQSPFPSLADAFYLGYAPFYFAGAVLLSTKTVSPSERLNNSLDLATILAVAILGFWNFLLGPTLVANIASPLLDQLILVAYPVSDLVLLGALLLIVYNDPVRQDIPSIALLGAGLLAAIVADSIYTYQGLLGTYVSGGPLDLGWVIDTLLVGLAAAAQWAPSLPPPFSADSKYGFKANASERKMGDREASRSEAEGVSRSDGGGWEYGRPNAIKTYLPYFWVLGAIVLLIVRGLTPLYMSFFAIAVGVGIIIALVLVRQLITLSENRKLNNELKSQAARLESTNKDLNAQIAERERMEAKLSYDTLHDAMTGLANRVLFLDRLGQALERFRRHHTQPFAVLFLDLDEFKVVNDSLGHMIGDELLIAMAERLRGAVRIGDTVARFGGDEFAVLLDDLGNEESARIPAERIHAAIQLPFNLKGHELYVTASIGIVTEMTQYEKPEDLLRDADLALYQAKGLGKARSETFALAMREQAVTRLDMENELRRGLERREFQVYYQPIKSLESDRIVGLEALVRWMHPSRGMLLPEDFLKIAEESGLLVPIGDWVLNQACRQMKTWQQEYAYLQTASVSVNLSDKQFAQSNLLEKVTEALTTSGLNGASLRLEITEKVLVGNYLAASHSITALQELGVQVQIDDFGTGYSALAYLQQYPINAIKIDRSFINDMSKSRKGLGLVKAIVSMARELGMDAIAEGIETGEQLNELKGLSCGFGQGFLLSIPMDAASLGKVLTTSKNGELGFW